MKKGFTLIELLLYLAIVSVIFAALIPFAWNVIEGGVKSGVQQEVASNAWLMMEKIKFKIRNAQSYTVVGNVLTLNGGTTTVQINGTNLQITEGGNAVNLNSAATTVMGLTFTDLQFSGTKQIQINMTVNSNYNQTRSEYRESVSLESSAEVRGI